MALIITTARDSVQQLPRTVGGRDAAPAEWKAWSEEPGHDLIALDDGGAIGGLHVSLVGRSEAWLEMLRVLPDYRGRGVAAQLVREGEQIARTYGALTLRTAIPANDYAAIGVAERAGLRRVLQCVVLETALSSGPLHLPYDAPSASPSPAAAPEILRFAERTQTLEVWNDLVPLGWRFRRITVDLVRGLITDGRVCLAMQPDARAASKIVSAASQGIAMFNVHEGDAVFSLVDGTPSGMQAAFASAAEAARDHGADRMVIFTPDLHSLDPLDLRTWAPHPWCPEGLVVVEKRLAS
ncbi:MAG: GNAT family N-acetyltransferase [Armatimonadetes bacterium]|nr:GNAT family N-acetyltransferase [Armatimonadota bacterium]